jgi:hypothetical protein
MGKKKENQMGKKKHIKKIKAQRVEKNTAKAMIGGDGCVPVR